LIKSKSPSRRKVERGRVLRPEMQVLGDVALVSRENVVKPPPTEFTHELSRAQPFYFKRGREMPDGEFAAGTRVVLKERIGASDCRVIDEQGLHVITPCKGLRPLAAHSSKK